jgi:enamine deaminase RidA (YjgF/YER057c/UK114 family)
MADITFLRPDGLLKSPAFSWVAVVPPGATTLHVGGINATDVDGKLVGDDVGAQTTQVMDNLRIALEAADASLRDLVSLQLFLVDGVDLTAGYQAAAAVLPTDREPPLVNVAIVPKLGVPGALLELSAIAAVVR